MAAVIKVETFDVNIASASETYTLTNDVGDISKAFVRRTTAIDKQSGLTTSTGNLTPRQDSLAAWLTDTDELTFAQYQAQSQKMVGEVWRYTGSAGGAAEFKVRGRHKVTLGTGDTTGSAAVSGIVNVDDCIPFWTGSVNSGASVSDHDTASVSVYIDSSDNIQVERGNSGTTMDVYVTVVEFTGSNWYVGHGKSANHDNAAETVTLKTGSDGVSGSTFDVIDWGKATIIEGSLESDTSETGLSDNLAVLYPGTNTTTVVFNHKQDGNARNDGVSYFHVLANANMKVTRDENTNLTEGNGSYGNITSFPSGTSTSESIDELALEWFVDTSGVGTAHARGRLSAYIDDATGNITHWVHRSGNTIRANWGVIDLSSVDGVNRPKFTTYPDVLQGLEEDQVITGESFGTETGLAKLEVWDAETSPTLTIEQTIVSWSATSITFDFVDTGLAEGARYFVITDSAGITSTPASFLYGDAPYLDVIKDMDNPPDIFHTLDDTYNDEMGGGYSANGLAQSGSYGFQAKPLTRGANKSWATNNNYSRIEMVDTEWTNITNTHTQRLIGGWIMLPKVFKQPTGFYEEGGGVNNLYFVVGFGNILLANIADSGGSPAFKAQAFSDFKLSINRPYHVVMKFVGASEFSLFIDGVKQTKKAGSVGTDTSMSTHSGDWAYGKPDGTLDTGGTDIQYPSGEDLMIGYFGTWSAAGNGLPPDSEIRSILFELGAPITDSIAKGTESAMQASVDLLADTAYVDKPLALKIPGSAGDFTIELDNITFDDRCSIHVQYTGTGTLTIINKNGSNCDLSKCSTLYGGTIVVINPVKLTLTGLQVGTEVRILKTGTQTDADSTASSEYVANTVGTTHEYEYLYPPSGYTAVDIAFINPGYKPIFIKNITLQGVDVTLPIQQRVDRNYVM